MNLLQTLKHLETPNCVLQHLKTQSLFETQTLVKLLGEMPGSDKFFVAFTDPILLHIVIHQDIVFVIIIFLIILLLFNP